MCLLLSHCAHPFTFAVYHHVSYQNDDGAVYLADDGQGTSKSVSTVLVSKHHNFIIL